MTLAETAERFFDRYRQQDVGGMLTCSQPAARSTTTPPS